MIGKYIKHTFWSLKTNKKAQILDNIETAEKQREESEGKIKEYEK